MRVIVYVEGPSDKAALEWVLQTLIQEKLEAGISIGFHPSPRGNKKLTLLQKVPVRAVDILRFDPQTHVVALPDLYPRNVGFDHETSAELQDGMRKAFKEALRKKNIEDDRLLDRFHVFCLKHDLEVLVLAAKEALLERLGAAKPRIEWKEPVEDQNHGRPPKEVVKELFSAHGKSYEQTIDAPLILQKADYRVLAERCFQCFKPFVEFLENLTPATNS